MPNFYAKEILDKQKVYCFGETFDKLFGWAYGTLTGPLCKSIDKYHYRKDKNGNPLVKDCLKMPFSMYYLTPEVLTMFRALYYNVGGFQDIFVNYMDVIGKKFSSNKYVLGFDPLNEPAPAGNGFVDNIKQLVLGYFDHDRLAPFYARLQKEVYNKYSNRTVNFFEPTIFPDIDNVRIGGMTLFSYVRTKLFTTPPGGKIGSKRHAFNNHAYCCVLDINICKASGEPTPESSQDCNNYHNYQIGKRQEDSTRMQVPFVLTEFGACMNTDECVREITQVTDIAERDLFSWAYW
jgi:hypothetical protein